MSPFKSVMTRYLAKALLCIAAVAALVVLAAGLMSSARTRSYTYRYRLVPRQAQATDAPLEEAAETIRARLAAMNDYLKLKGGEVRTEPPDLIRLTLQSTEDPENNAAPAWLTTPGRVAFHLLHPRQPTPPSGEESSPGYETRVYRTQEYNLTRAPDMRTVEEEFLVTEEPVLVVDGLREAEMHTVGLERATVLTFRFRESDAEKFASVTALHAGRSMAMLVDGEMFFPPKEIEGAVNSDTVQVQGYFYTIPLQKLVALLNTGALPGRLVPLQEGDQEGSVASSSGARSSSPAEASSR
ncbi:MAG: hypothetical protein R6X33_10860 [Candidatus Brocadiia bacterium]